MKIGAKNAGTGESVYNWITAWWFTFIAGFIRNAFIAQDKSIAQLAKAADVVFFDLKVRIWGGKLYISNGIFLFNKTLAAAIRDIENNKGDKAVRYRVQYDDLIPKSVWKWKLLKRLPIDINYVINKVRELFTENGVTESLVSVTFASRPDVGIVFKKVNYVTAPRVYHSDELKEFLAYLATTPTGIDDIVDATPNEVFNLTKGLITPHPELWKADIRKWLNENRSDSKATYLINYV